MRLKIVLAVVMVALVSLSGCAGRYFQPAGKPQGVTRYTPETLPTREVWTGLVFNGAKVGFTHTTISPAPGPRGHYEIRAEASLLLRMLGFEKKILLRSYDLVRDDLTLERFEAHYVIDQAEFNLEGAARDGRLAMTIGNAGRTTTSELAYEDPLYPTSAVGLYPLIHGLEVGRQYQYVVFSGETQRLAKVEQSVEAFERSELFSGEAYKIITRLQGQKTTSWIDAQGRPLLEIDMNGVMISGLEDEQTAKRYLAAASLNKQDALIDFSLIRVDPPIDDARNVVRMTVDLTGADIETPSAPGQQCEGTQGHWRCELDASRRLPAEGKPAAYLRSSLTVPYTDPEIRRLAAQIAANTRDDEQRLHAILDWLDANIRKEAADVFSALDVLASRRAECQGHAYLYAALARAMGIPTRVANGMVYSEPHKGFLYHSWAESLIGGEWRAVDPTFGQPVADATHVKLVEGEDFGDLVPLAESLGRVSARIVRFEYAR